MVLVTPVIDEIWIRIRAEDILVEGRWIGNAGRMNRSIELFVMIDHLQAIVIRAILRFLF
jgi:hypothetical protein